MYLNYSRFELGHRPVSDMQQTGILVINKPSGISSAGCISRLKRLGQKKIGHAGTLDPMAKGVLIVLLGQATKLSGYLLEGGEKMYSGELLLGVTTDTWDREGTVLERRDPSGVSESDVLRFIAEWQGRSIQVVPPYSAAKHQGQPLYKLARAGAEVPLKTKEIFISHAEVQSVDLPRVRFRVTCSSGSYIRSLAHSLGMRAGCGAVLTELTREYSHPYGIGSAVDPAALLAEPELLPKALLPLESALPGWPVLIMDAQRKAKLKNGNPVPIQGCDGDIADGQKALLRAEDEYLALAEARGKSWVVLRGLFDTL